MPHIAIDGPVLKDVEKKRKLIRDITTAATEAYGIPKEAMVVIIKEHSPENVGVGGELLADKRR